MRFFITIIIFSLVLVSSSCQSSSANQSDSVSQNQTQSKIKQITVEQAQEEVSGKDVQFIDVRTIEEYQSGHAPKTVNLPLDSLEENLSKLDKSKPVYVICQTGRRSQKGAEILEANGFKQLFNIEGGTIAWEKAGLPIEK